jgi:site-specific recombinase XerD
MSLKVVPFVKRNDIPYMLVDGEDLIDSVYDFLKLFHARGLSKNTIRAYAYDLLAFYRFLRRSNLKIELMTHSHLADFILLQRRENTAPRTINRRITVVRCFLNVQYDQLGDELLSKIITPSFYKGTRNKALLGNSRLKQKTKKNLTVKVPSLIITPLSPTEIKKFLIGIRKYRDLAIIYLMLFCGLRSCEILALEVADIDLIDNQIRVRGKGGKQRVLPISGSVRKILIYYLDYERPHASHNRCFVVLKGHSRGEPMTETGLRKLFRYRRKRSFLPRAHPHLFRHTFCTNLITQGVSLPVVQKLMGHTDIELTMSYTHISLSDVYKEYHQATKLLQESYDAEVIKNL